MTIAVTSSTTIFGIRHHGPGCARSLMTALEALAPDVILLEMPQEAEPLLAHAADPAMKPPVALLLHRTDRPQVASFYPFAEFSPEWQTLLYAARKGVSVRCFDLPAAHMLALRSDEESEEEAPVEKTDTEEQEQPADPTLAPPPQPEPEGPRGDPFEWFARADGYSDGERWWNDRVEERRDQAGFFEAILEAVTVLRDELAMPETRETLLREAWMRKCMRAAEKDGFTNIAIVCGAWHAPALKRVVKVSEDNALLKNLPKHKVAATWVPWTEERLAMASGYSAGIRSPGWYGHLWREREDPIPSWLARAARVLRKEGQEASSASIIEAVRLANSLAGMRGRPLPGLDETLESIQAIFCHGDALPLDFLRRKLLLGERMGELPKGLPQLPLQQDIEAQQKRLRLKPVASITPLDLDLREDGGRARSLFLHRLLALQIQWGRKTQARTKGTFKESWSLQWKPHLAVSIIDAAAYGNTLETAASNRLLKGLKDDSPLTEITERLDLALLAALPLATEHLLRRLDAAAATCHDVSELLDSVPPLARIARYGDVRTTEAAPVLRLLGSLSSRIHAGLITASTGIDETAADKLTERLAAYHSALGLLEDGETIAGFQATLGRLAESHSAHGKPRGLAVRILRDAGAVAEEEVARHLSYALSAGTPPLSAAAWLEGFLQGGGGSLLVHDRALLALVDGWLASLSADAFQATLPLLRRTFGSFEAPERSRIGSAVRQPGELTKHPALSSSDLPRALPAVAAVARLFGLPLPASAP